MSGSVISYIEDEYSPLLHHEPIAIQPNLAIGPGKINPPIDLCRGHPAECWPDPAKYVPHPQMGLPVFVFDGMCPVTSDTEIHLNFPGVAELTMSFRLLDRQGNVKSLYQVLHYMFAQLHKPERYWLVEGRSPLSAEALEMISDPDVRGTLFPTTPELRDENRLCHALLPREMLSGFSPGSDNLTWDVICVEGARQEIFLESLKKAHEDQIQTNCG